MAKRVKAESVALPLPKKASKAVTKLDGKPQTTARVATTKTAKKTPRIELWTYDAYNFGTIIFSSTDIEKVVERARAYVNESNVDNALASGEKDKHWSAYYVDIFKGKKLATDVVYAGNKRDGRHYVYAQKDGEWKLQLLNEEADIRFYLGQNDRGRVKEDWYLADYKGTQIDDFKSQELEQKTVVFIKVC